MITVRISGTYAQAFTCDRLTSGMVGLPVHFEFSQEWDGLIKNAVFRGSHELRTVLNITDQAVVPWECLTLPGTALEIGVEGRSGDGQIVIPTIYAVVGRISVGADDNAEIAQEATPTALEQIIAAVEEVNAKVPDEGEIDYVLTKTENGNAWLPPQGGGGTSNYNSLSNKPKINGVELLGDKTLEDLGIEIPTELSELQGDEEHRTVSDDEKAEWSGKQNAIDESHKLPYSLLSDTPTIPTIPSNVSEFENDAGYLTIETLPVYEGGVV